MNEAERTSQADALIKEIHREGAGRLTVFLGAAPGVGKTYAMLGRARELRQRGIDVVVGIAETHGRGETAALLQGLEQIARKPLGYRGRVLEEMDLDALLARRPQLAVVDELAHRNVPGSRHERRWQDVAELLDAGIDVYTTLNVQHLESLNDIVHQITGVRVTETVPDAVFDRLRDIRLVDLSPGELIERLNQGKVYLPEQAAQALQGFFSPSNLAALRELALQTAAERVDTHPRRNPATGALPAAGLRRRVLIAIDGQGQSEYMVRAGRRIAQRRATAWTVVTVQPHGGLDAARQADLDRAFALARQLGADTQTLHGADVAGTLLDYAARSGACAIVIGRARKRPWTRRFCRGLSQQLLQDGAGYELTLVSAPDADAQARPARQAAWTTPSFADLALAVAATVAAVLLAWLSERWVGLSDLSMVFLVAVVLVAARTQMTAAVVTATLCFLSYNFLFIEPRYTLQIGGRQGVVTVFLFLLAALVAGRLASALRTQVLALRAANAHGIVLQALGRRLASAADAEQVARAGRDALEAAFAAQAWLRIGEAVPAPAAGMTPLDVEAAGWAYRHGQAAGRYTNTLAGSDWWFLPMRSDAQVLGVAGLRFAPHAQHLVSEQRRLAEAMVEDIAQAGLRARLVADLQAAKVSSETERLRSALLSSVSHDLRSPLAAMIGAADSLGAYWEPMSREDRRGLLDTITLEGKRLDRYIQNLLDMTRLGHEGLVLNRGWVGVDELLGSAARRLLRYQPGLQLDMQLPDDLPDIWVHPALVEQALFNVMENAGKFSPPGAPILIEAKVTQQTLRIDISDRGPGIPDDERERIFDMFYSVERGDRGRQGTGLGLSICKGMIGAHGGRVEAFAGPGATGTTIRISLPLTEAPPTRLDDDTD